VRFSQAGFHLIKRLVEFRMQSWGWHTKRGIGDLRELGGGRSPAHWVLLRFWGFHIFLTRRIFIANVIRAIACVA
jgi:hypothetical protein